jgi:hypothetical protein
MVPSLRVKVNNLHFSRFCAPDGFNFPSGSSRSFYFTTLATHSLLSFIAHLSVGVLMCLHAPFVPPRRLIDTVASHPSSPDRSPTYLLRRKQKIILGRKIHFLSFKIKFLNKKVVRC